jgi:predicted small lipoprotein YifL
MKKILSMLMVAAVFSLVACGPAEKAEVVTEEVVTEEVATEEVATEEVVTELAEHVCADKCTEEACHYACGEKGHECSDACHATEEATEEHVHTEGEEHSH